MNNKKSGVMFRFLIRASLSIIALLWVWRLLQGIDWGITRASLGNLAPGFLVASLFCLGLVYLTRLYRLRYWCERLPGKRISGKEWVELYLKSLAFGSVTPGRIGDFSRITLLARTELSLLSRSKVVLQDKAADLLYLPVGLCLTSKMVGERFNLPPEWLLGIGLSFILAYLYIAYRFADFLDFKAFMAGMGITLAGFCLYILGNTFLFWTVGVNLSLLDITAITLGVGFLSSLPMSIAGIGIREGSLIYILGIWGVQPDAAPPVLLLEFLLNIIYPVALWIGWLAGVKAKKMLRP